MPALGNQGGLPLHKSWMETLRSKPARGLETGENRKLLIRITVDTGGENSVKQDTADCHVALLLAKTNFCHRERSVAIYKNQ